MDIGPFYDVRMAGEESLLTVCVKVKRYFLKSLEKRRVGRALIAPGKLNRLYFGFSHSWVNFKTIF